MYMGVPFDQLSSPGLQIMVLKVQEVPSFRTIPNTCFLFTQFRTSSNIEKSIPHLPWTVFEAARTIPIPQQPYKKAQHIFWGLVGVAQV